MPSLTRKRFLTYGAAGGAALFLPGRLTGGASAQAPPLLNALAQPKFANPLPDGLAPGFRFAPSDGAAHYEIQMRQTVQQLGIVDPLGAKLWTPVWGYGSQATGQGTTYPGRTFVAHKNQPVTVRWHNDLVTGTGAPLPHLLPVDTTVHWAFSHADLEIDDVGVPLVTHVHGGHTEFKSDGLPEFWYTPGWSYTGADFQKYGAAQTHRYDNDQEAGTIWYHDHALGITRLNVYAGLAGFFLIRDEVDTGLAGNDANLPVWPYEQLLAIQDRMFTAEGRLFYPSEPDVKDAPEPSILPEFFGDVLLVNGVAWPYLDVERRKYRLRLLNGSDSRFYSLQFNRKGGPPLTKWVIGTDGGLLEKPVEVKGALVLGPGERLDVIVDFAEVGIGTQVMLTNGAATPFPLGAPVAPPADQVMAFNVTTAAPTDLVDPLPGPFRTAPFSVPGAPALTRPLLLFEGTDEFGRIFAQLGTPEAGGIEWDDPVTEAVGNGTVEVWEVFNTTPDAHPIHLHLPQFEVLDRAPFKATQDKKTGAIRNVRVGAPVAAPAWERGPKDTAQMLPGEVTRIKALFDRPGEYVWHCHILSHEDHEMMRRYVIS
jgi:spore coat protein A, manganese oxidase